MRNVDPEDLGAQRLALRSQPRGLVGTRKGQQREKPPCASEASLASYGGL